MPSFNAGQLMRLGSTNESILTSENVSLIKEIDDSLVLSESDLLSYTILLLSDRPTEKNASYKDEPSLILTFGPGIVRYLRGTDIKQINYQKIINEIQLIGNPCISIPDVLPLISTNDPDAPSYSWDIPKIELNCFECIASEIDYKCQIGLISFIADEYRRSPFSCRDYWTFSHFLGLTRLHLEEFRFCFIKTESQEVLNSYIGSDAHEVVNYGVFLKSHFWNEARRDLEKIVEAQKQVEVEHLQNIHDEASHRKLAESNYTVFVYVMEDTRNGLIKTGKSKHPKKPERTLQSEAPSTQLRLAVPCDETTEVELHERYSTARVRGEWFKIDHNTLFELVAELLRRGDAARTVTEEQWLGSLMIRSHFSDDSQ